MSKQQKESESGEQQVKPGDVRKHEMKGGSRAGRSGVEPSSESRCQ